MVTGDGAYIKKINRGIILKHIVQHEFISRANISHITGLNKATVSVQVADLIAEDLITESTQEHSTIGRKPIMLSINGSAGYVLGVDLDYHKIQFTVCNLQGQPVQHEIVRFETDDYNEIVDILVNYIKKYQEEYAKCTYGLIHAIIGIHGIVHKETEAISFISYQWANKNLKADLEAQVDVKINLENNANLSAFAETVYKHHMSDHLVTILMTSGIGSGIMIDGKLYRGNKGHAGEPGHMIIAPGGKSCKCGNEGCWERYASEPAFFEQISNYLNRRSVSYREIQRLVEVNDPIVKDYLHEFIAYLALGLNNIINLYNPETIVLNSKLLKIYPHAVEEIETQLHSSVSNYRNIVLSSLGSTSSVLGASALAIKQFLEVPEVRFTISDISLPKSKSIDIHQVH